jgi:hypothetical protein
VGAGLRLIFLTLGGRFRLARSSAWNVYTFDAELGLHLPVGALEPSFTFAVGYADAELDAVSAETIPYFDAERVDVDGANARLGANLDYYVNPLLSFGARASVEVLALWRAGAEQPFEMPEPAPLPVINAAYTRDGDGVGFGVTLSAAVGLHF